MNVRSKSLESSDFKTVYTPLTKPLGSPLVFRLIFVYCTIRHNITQD